MKTLASTSNPERRTAFPDVALYLFFGNKTEAILRARDELLGAVLDEAARAANLTEYQPMGRTFGVELLKILPEIEGDLSTMSFLPGAAKAIVVVNPMELYGSAAEGGFRTSRKKRSAKSKAGEEGKEEAKGPGEHEGLRWLAEVLPSTGNRLVLLAFEDEAHGREVNDRSALFQFFARHGHTQAFRDNKAFFRIENALAGRRAEACLAALRELWKGQEGTIAAYGSVVRCLRFLRQATIERERRATGDPVKFKLFYPERAQFNLFKSSDFVRRKYAGDATGYRAKDLLVAYERLTEVYAALRPRGEDVYVPDAQRLLERILMELMAAPARPEKRE